MRPQLNCMRHVSTRAQRIEELINKLNSAGARPNGGHQLLNHVYINYVEYNINTQRWQHSNNTRRFN